MMTRRSILRAALGSALALPFTSLIAKSTSAGPLPRVAKRLIVFYFPDGIPAPAGEGSRFYATGNETSFQLPENLQPLAPFQRDCVFLRGLSMGPTGSGSHPEGAKKLLTGVDGAEGESIDRYLARTVGGGAPFRHLYLGAMATQNNATGDKFISYPSARTTSPPEDNPLVAFQRLFGTAGGGTGAADGTEASILDASLADLNDLRARLGDTEKTKLDLHLEALRDVEKRVKASPPPASCGHQPASLAGVVAGRILESDHFPNVLRAQIDLAVQAMACGLTNVGVVQCSQHTSDLVMSRFQGSPQFDSRDMRSHEASHYGQTSDVKYGKYVLQRTWFVQQFAYLLDQLRQRPDGAGTMLDTSLCLLCSEVADGNTHSHDDVPFVLAGRAGGAVRTGRLVQLGYRRHSDLLVTLARAMGDPVATFGQECRGPLGEILA